MSSFICRFYEAQQKHQMFQNSLGANWKNTVFFMLDDQSGFWKIVPISQLLSRHLIDIILKGCYAELFQFPDISRPLCLSFFFYGPGNILTWEKCSRSCSHSFKYLGHIITPRGIKPHSDHIKLVREMPASASLIRPKKRNPAYLKKMFISSGQFIWYRAEIRSNRKEALAWTYERFHNFLTGKKFELFADYKSLVPLLRDKDLNTVPTCIQWFRMRPMKF